jgi:hypothetical protein
MFLILYNFYLTTSVTLPPQPVLLVDVARLLPHLPVLLVDVARLLPHRTFARSYNDSVTALEAERNLCISRGHQIYRYKEIRRLDPGCGDGEYESAAWVNFLAAISSVICWAIMSRWVTVMNNEKGSSRSKDTDTLKFDDLETGIGMSLMLISWLALFVNTILCVLCAKEQGVMARARGAAPPVLLQASTSDYLDVSPVGNDYEPPARAPPGREPPAPPMNKRNSTSSDV